MRFPKPPPTWNHSLKKRRNGTPNSPDCASRRNPRARPTRTKSPAPPSPMRSPVTTSPAATPEGLLLVDKPGGLTSHDVVSRVRWLAGTRKVGHAGTLDPMATGLLVLGIGRATRLLTHLVGLDKTYTATIRLGQTTSTDDAEGDTLAAEGAALTREGVQRELPALTGAIEQVPSQVSAIKIDGKRAYERARAGETVQIPARSVTVHEFAITGLRPATTTAGVDVTDVDVRVRCSSGTYIRALARDLGERLGVGGHLTTLRRSHVGPFDVTHAMELPERSDDRPPLQEQIGRASCREREEGAGGAAGRGARQ